MEKFSQEFNQQLFNFLTDLYKFTNDTNVKKLLDIYDKIHTYKTAKKFIEIIGKYSDKIDDKNESLFKNKLLILPGIDLCKLWHTLSSEQKNKIWLYLQLLYISGNMIVQESTETKSSIKSDTETAISVSNNNLDAETESKQSEMNKFNPFIGVGSDDANNFSTDDLFSGPDKLPGESNNSSSSLLPNMSSLANLIDINKFIDVKKLSEQLKQITDEDITAALSKLKETLGDDMNEEATKTLTEMFKEITNELKKINADNLQLGDILNVLETIINKIIPKLQASNFDMKNMWKIAQNLSSKFNTGAEDNNNLKILTSFMEQQFKMIENMSDSNAAMTDEKADEYLKQCNDVLKDLGMENVDIKNLDISSITKTLTSGLSANGNNIDLSAIQNLMGNSNGGIDTNAIQSLMSNLMGGGAGGLLANLFGGNNANQCPYLETKKGKKRNNKRK